MRRALLSASLVTLVIAFVANAVLAEAKVGINGNVVVFEGLHVSLPGDMKDIPAGLVAMP